MVPFDRSCTTYYWSAIVSTAGFLSYLTLNNIVTLVQMKFNMTTLCLDNQRQSLLAADQSLGSVCPGLAEPRG